MKKKLFGTAILGGLMCVSVAFAACSPDAQESESNSESVGTSVAITGEHLLNGFNTLDELYRIKWINALDSIGNIDVNTEPEYTKEGSGSLKIDIKTTKNDPEFNFKIQNCALPEMDVTDLKNVSVWVYNANETEVNATLNVLKTDNTHLLSESFVLPAKGWTECVMPVNAVVTKYAAQSVGGFSFTFDAVSNSLFYVDEFNAEFGKVFSAEDEKYIAQIEKLLTDIGNIPSKITVEDEGKLSAIYNEYNALPDIYKSAVTNYSTLSVAMSDLLNVRFKADGALDVNERTAYYFDKFYGVTQMKNAETSKNTFGYTKDVKFGEEDGSTYIQYYGDVWNYTDITTSLTLENYDYITLSLYNDGEERAIWFNSKKAGWMNRVDLKGGEWKTVQIPTAYCDASSVQLIVTTSIDGGAASSVNGRLYVSSVKGYKLGESRTFVDALEATPYSAENVETATADGLTSVTATADGDVDLYFNKTVKSISVAQNAVTSFYAPKALSLTILDVDGNEVASVSCSEGWNTVVLESSQYNSLAYMRFDASEGETYKLGVTYVVRKSDLQAANLFLGRDYLTAIEDAGVTDLPSYIAYLKLYDDDNLVALKPQFVKASEALEPELYAEQLDLYNGIVDNINLMRDKANSLMEKLIDRANDSNVTVNDLYLLNAVYEDYVGAKLTVALSNEYDDKANTALNQMVDLPLRLVDVTSAADRAKFSILAKYFPWKGSITYENGVNGSVMRLKIKGATKTTIEFQYDNSVNLDDYDYVAFSVYTATGKDLRFSTIGWGSVKAEYSLSGGKWTQIVVPKAAYTSAGYMLFSGVAETDEILFGDFYAYNAKSVVREINALPNESSISLKDEAAVVAARNKYENLSDSSKNEVTNIEVLEVLEAKLVTIRISELPDAEDVTFAHGEQIAEASNAYNALGENAKKKISSEDLAKLNACIKVSEDDKFVMSADTLSKAQVPTWDLNYDVTEYQDETHGKGIKVTRKSLGNIALSINAEVVNACDLTGYSYVVFFVYNSHSEDKTVRKMNAGWGYSATIITDYSVLDDDGNHQVRASGWTQCYTSVQDFKNTNGNYFCFYDRIPNGESIIISNFYAVKTLPEWGEQSKPETPDEPVDANPAESVLPQGYIRAYSAFNVTTTDVATWPNKKGVVSFVKDETYGSGMKYTFTSEWDQGVALQMDVSKLNAVDLSGYTKVVFWVYSDSSNDWDIRKMNTGWGYVASSLVTDNANNNKQIKGKTWTKCEMSVADFKNAGGNCLVFYGDGCYNTYLIISDFYAVK